MVIVYIILLILLIAFGFAQSLAISAYDEETAKLHKEIINRLEQRIIAHNNQIETLSSLCKEAETLAKLETGFAAPTNCRNCGAVINNGVCEYCGTHYT